ACALLSVYHVCGGSAQLRRTANRSRGPAQPSSSLVCTVASNTWTCSGPFSPSRTVTVRHRPWGCRATHWSTRSNAARRAAPPRLGGHVRRHIRRAAPDGVGSPVVSQVQAPLHQGTAARGGVGQEDAHLAVVHFAEAAAPLAGHTTGSRAFLGEATGVEDEDG